MSINSLVKFQIVCFCLFSFIFVEGSLPAAVVNYDIQCQQYCCLVSTFCWPSPQHLLISSVEFVVWASSATVYLSRTPIAGPPVGWVPTTECGGYTQKHCFPLNLKAFIIASSASSTSFTRRGEPRAISLIYGAPFRPVLSPRARP